MNGVPTMTETLTTGPKLPEPSAVGDVNSAIAVHATGRRSLSFLRYLAP